jgi:hypothetical protein
MRRFDDSWNDDEFHFVRRPPPPSAAVSTLGILAIIYGAISLFCSGVSALLSLVIVAAEQQNILPRDFMMSWGVFWLASATTFFVTCIGGIAGGIGVLHRRKLGRWTMLVVGVVQLAMAGFYTFVLMLSSRNNPGDEDFQQAWAFMIIGLVLQYAFALYTLIVLLAPRYAEEFH